MFAYTYFYLHTYPLSDSSDGLKFKVITGLPNAQSVLAFTTVFIENPETQ